MNKNEYFLLAIEEAKKAFKKSEIPVGAIIVKNDKVIARSHNNSQKKYNPLGHAEINCILKAAKYNKDWRLDDGYELYVTLEPCEMCKSIINKCRIMKVHYLIASDSKKEFDKSKITQTNDCNDLKKEYLKLFKKFFKNLR